MNILVVCKRRYTHRDLLDDRFGRLYQLPRRWAADARVAVLCVDYAGSVPATRVMDGVSFRAWPAHRNPLGLVAALRGIARQAAAFRPDVVVASGDLIVGLAGARVARRAGSAFVFDVYDDYRDFPAMRWSGLALAFGPLCRRADGLLSASPALADSCRVFNAHTQVVPNGYDPAVFHPGSRQAARHALGIADDVPLAVFTGSVDARFDLDTVQAAFNALHAQDARTRLAVIGAGSQALAGAPWAIASPPVAQDVVARWIHAADVCLAPYRDVPLARTASPCKLAEYLACGRPVLTVDFPEFAGYVALGARTCRAGDAAALAAGIAGLLQAPPSVQADRALDWDRIADDSLAFLAARVAAHRGGNSPA